MNYELAATGRTVDSAEELRRLRDAASPWGDLRTYGITPVRALLLTATLLVAPAVLLRRQFGVSHWILTRTFLGVLLFDTAVLWVLTRYFDRRIPSVLEAIQPSFNAPAADVYAFFGRLLDRVYTNSFYSPVLPAPDGNRHVPSLFGLWAAAFGVGVWWTAPIALIRTLDPAIALSFAAYYLAVFGYVTFLLYTSGMLVLVVLLAMGDEVRQFPVRLDFTNRSQLLGFEPLGTFFLTTSLIVAFATGVTGYLAVVRVNPVFVMISICGAVFVAGWFVGGQYGIYRSITETKRRRLAQLGERHFDEIETVASESTDEPTVESMQKLHSFVVVKRELETLPNWPTNVRGFYQVVSAVVLSNVPTFVAILT